MSAKAIFFDCRIFLVLAVLLAGPGDCTGDEGKASPTELTQAFLAGTGSYREGNYATAVEHFRRITAAGVVNGKLYYNLANAYLKDDDLGRAILWYERALELIPGDPDLKFNYEYAASLVQDEASEKGAVQRILFFWKYQMSSQAVIWTAVALNAFFWLTLSLRIFRRKRPLNAAVSLLMGAVLVFVLTAGYGFYEEKHLRRGVVLSSKVSVRSGLTPEATELFVLHAGTRVQVENENREFFRIYFAPGKIGWIRKEEVGII